MSKTSPTQRSLKMLRNAGWTCGVTERFNPHVGPHGIRQDFCGGIDVIAFKSSFPAGREVIFAQPLVPPDWIVPNIPENARQLARMTGDILGVQCCAGSGLAAHRTKLLAEPRMREWVAAGGRLVIHAWRQLAVVKKDGKKGKARRYECNEVELRLEDFPTGSAPAPSAASPAGR